MSNYYAILVDTAGRLRFNVQVPAYVWDEGGVGMVWFEMATRAMSAANAFRANIYRNRRTVSKVDTDIKIIDSETLNVIKLSVKPKTRFQMVHHGNHHIMMHEGLDRMHLDYLIGGDALTPSPWFVPCMQQFVNVPFLSRWAIPLWREGVDDELITKLPAIGDATVWKIKKDSGPWSEMIRRMHSQGDLTV